MESTELKTREIVSVSHASLKSKPVSTEGLEDLIEKFTEPLMRTAYGMGFQETEAEELVQDTLVSFLKARDRFEGHSKVQIYLFGFLYNRIRESRRKKIKEETAESIDDIFYSHFDDEGNWNQAFRDEIFNPASSLLNKELGVLLKDCMEKLVSLHRMAFTMKVVERMEAADICMALGLNTSHLGVVLFRARNQLRECLKTKIRLS